MTTAARTMTKRPGRLSGGLTLRSPLRLLSGNGNLRLSQQIAACMGVALGRMQVGRFSSGEVRVAIEDNVRGCDVFVVESMAMPINDHLMELLVIVDALRRASAARVTAVVPYYPYARQDRKSRGREPISAKLVANLLTMAGVDRVVTMDLHAPQIQGFFDIPLDHLTGVPILAEYLRGLKLPRPMVVSPDAGGVNRGRELAERLGAPVGFVDKRRPEPGVAEVMNLVGRVQGRTAILVDDMIDTAGTITEAAKALLAYGASEVYVAGTHAVFSGPAVERLGSSDIRQIVVTDTLPLPPDVARDPRYRVLSVAPLLAQAILRIHQHKSVTELFEI
jgi:ribose-phosphate pyrophosphokinase